eukprot:GDKK01018049.1.p1 GENE.GDKK01018049.1~~GDKK01018049.1.p1  ORF type:complete len:604 (-),score=158.74 GDKK01018049.1:119-1684(-)
MGGMNLLEETAEKEEEEHKNWGFSVEVFSAPRITMPTYDEDEQDEEDERDEEEDQTQGEVPEIADEKRVEQEQIEAPAPAVATSSLPRSLYWTDLIQSEFHHRSIVEITSSNPPAGYSSSSFLGRACPLLASELYEMEESLRLQLEQSERLDSVQVLWDAYSPVSSLVKNYCRMISEECPKTSCLFTPIAHEASRLPFLPSMLKDPGLLANLTASEEEEEEVNEYEMEMRHSRASLLRQAGAAMTLIEAMDSELEHMSAAIDFSFFKHPSTLGFDVNDFTSAVAMALDGVSLPMRMRSGGVASLSHLSRLVSAPHETVVGMSLAPWIPKPQLKASTSDALKHATNARMRRILEASLPPPPAETPLPFFELGGVSSVGQLAQIPHRHQFASARFQSLEELGRAVDVMPKSVEKNLFLLGAPAILPKSFSRNVLIGKDENRTCDVTSNITRLHNARAGGGCASLKSWSESFIQLKRSRHWAEISNLVQLEDDEWSEVRSKILEHDFMGVDKGYGEEDGDDDDE